MKYEDLDKYIADRQARNHYVIYADQDGGRYFCLVLEADSEEDALAKFEDEKDAAIKDFPQLKDATFQVMTMDEFHDQEEANFEPEIFHLLIDKGNAELLELNGKLLETAMKEYELKKQLLEIDHSRLEMYNQCNNIRVYQTSLSERIARYMAKQNKTE